MTAAESDAHDHSLGAITGYQVTACYSERWGDKIIRVRRCVAVFDYAGWYGEAMAKADRLTAEAAGATPATTYHVERRYVCGCLSSEI